MKPAALCSLLLLFAAVAPAHAITGPSDKFLALPCRPTVACTADIVGPGMFEIEAGYNLRRGPDGTTHTTPFLLKYTVFPWLQLQAGGNGLLRNSMGSDFDDVYAGVKLHLRDQEDLMPSFAVSAMLGIPTGPSADDHPNRTMNGYFNFLVTKEKGIVHGDFNLGVNLYNLEAAARAQVWGALALSVALPRQFTIMGELWGMSEAQPSVSRDAGFLFALAYAPKSYLIFDIGGDAGLIRDVRSISFFVGMTIIPLSTH